VVVVVVAPFPILSLAVVDDVADNVALVAAAASTASVAQIQDAALEVHGRLFVLGDAW
jgi:hypothetical protein